MKSLFPFNRHSLGAILMLWSVPALLSAAPLNVTTPANVNINDTQSTNLFSTATVTENNSNVVQVLIDFSPSAFGSLTLPPNGSVVSGTNVLTVTNAADAQASLRAVVFVPTANVIPVPNVSNVLFHVKVVDSGDSTASDSTTLHIAATNDASVLATAGPFTHNITDKTTTTVFTGMTITDVDDGGAQPVTVTITLDTVAKGAFTTLSGFVSNSLNYTFTGTPSAATAAIHQLVFVPTPNRVAPGSNETTTFTVSVTDGYTTTNSTAYSVTALSVNDAPTINAGTPFTHGITDAATTPVFTNVTIADVDLSGAQPIVLTVFINETNNGVFTNYSPAFTNSGGIYTFNGTPAAATTALRALTFIPTENQVPVGSNVTTTFTITVDDQIAAPVTNASYSVTALSTNDLPQLTGVTSGHLPAQAGYTLAPFSVLTLSDADQNIVLTNTHGEDLTWTVTLSGSSPLGNLELGGVNIGTSYSSSGDPAVDTQNLRLLNYHAPTVAISGTNVLTLAVVASDAHGGTVSNNVYLDLYSLIAPPALSGTQSGQTVNDNTTVAPFSKVSIQSFNGNSVTVRISLVGVTNDVQGQLINLGSFIRTINAGATSLYQFTGSSEAATAATRALLFQPTPNRINGSSTETATFGITLVDGPFTNAPDVSTTVIVVPVNDAPVIAGISPLVTIQDNQTLPPFTTVLIGDADESGLQSVTAIISLDDPAKGAFSTNSLTASGFVLSGNNYTFTGTPAALTTAIRQLVFVPTPNRVPVGLNEITTFTINLNDGHGGVINNSGTSVRVTSVSGGPILNLPPQPVSIRVDTNIFPLANITVSDSTLLKMRIQMTDPAQGYFRTNSFTGGFTNLGNGSYFISNYATNINAALALLNFTPSPSLPVGAIINFTISVTNALPNFVSANHAVILRTVQNSFIVTRLTDYDPNAVVPDSSKYGTLRLAVASAKNNDHITFDIRSQTNGQPDYPAIIRLVAPLVLNNNVTFDGPGAERLTISGDSDNNGTADVQLFTVNAAVTMNRLTFTKGYASFAGGAFEVTASGDLKLSYCAVTASQADFWGGGIDVDNGSLILDHCLIAGNSTSSTLGEGGGGVSLYTYLPCTIVNTTFATNRQAAVGGLGGGALYAETADAGMELDAEVLNCTFHDNRDAAGHGTSIRPNVFNTVVELQNTIVADGQGKNIEMDQSGDVVSLGGNVSDDATAANFSIGGAATNTYVFHPPQDKINVNVSNILAALSNNGGPTLTFPLITNSVAIGAAISNVPTAAFFGTLGTDQRGYFRDHSPDVGAYEFSAGQRIMIEELRFNPAPPNTNDQFVELYVPRDSAALDVAGFKLLVDGVVRHTFASQPLQPGEALVLFSLGTVSNGVPSGVHSQMATNKLMMDATGGTITLLNASNQVVFEAGYVGAFTATDPADYGFLSSNYQSLVLSPQFQGVFLPYQRVVAKEGGSNTNGLANPGYDVLGAPLAIGNAPPLAYDDAAGTDAHTVLPQLNVLINDVDPDIADTLSVVAVGTNGNVSGPTNYSALGARLIIATNGATISYDPTASVFLTSLPQGSNVVDTFQYTILDFLNGVPHARGSNVTEIAQNLVKATATVTVSVTGVNSAPTPQSDSVGTSTKLTTPEDVVLDFTTATNVLQNDTDPNSDDNSSTLTIVSISGTNGYIPNSLSVTSALGAIVTLDIRFDRNETHITYDPRGSAILNALNAGQSTNDIFYYSVKDRYNAIGTAAISIQVTGVSDSPVANADIFSTDEDTRVTNSIATFLANDTDPDNSHVLTLFSIQNVSALGAGISVNGTNVIYDPTISPTLNALANKEFATDTFSYVVVDENGLSSTGLVAVTVAGVNDTPVSYPDAYVIDEDTMFVTNAPGVLANNIEFDINGITPDDSIRAIPATNTTPQGVIVVVNANGGFNYDPRGLFDWLKSGQTTNDSFSYVVMDHSLSIAADDNFAVTSDTANNVLPVLANDSVLSQAGGAFTITGVTSPTNGGTVTINVSSNAILYTPAAAFTGQETFSYSVRDGLGGTDTAKVTANVTGNTLYAIADAFIVATGTTNSVNVLANDLILPTTGASLSVTALGTPSLGGTVSLNGLGANNAVNYSPDPLRPCPFVETFSYTVTSGLLVATGMVSMTVIDRTTAPTALIAKPDNFTVLASSGNNSLDVLANDLVLPGPNTNLVIASFTSNSVIGTVSLNTAHTRLVYKPDSTVTSTNGYFVSIPYTISDNAGGTGSASALIHVITAGFIANDDTFVVEKNSTSNTVPVMVNDVLLPSDGQTLFVSGLGIGTNAPNFGGTVSINPSGTGLLYTPAANFTGVEDFTYEISDGSPARALGHVHIQVLDFATAPSSRDTYRVARNSANNALLVLNNDYPLPRTPGALTITALQTNSVHATISINGAIANNSLLYTPNSGFIGRDDFNYEFVDALGNKGTNAVTVTVGNLAPRADCFTVLSGTTTNRLDVLANDFIYPDSTTIRAVNQVSTADAGGAVAIEPGGNAVLYTPASGFTGTEHFTYALKDDSTNLFAAQATVRVYARGSDRSTNTVSFTIIGVNDLPQWTGNVPSAITDKQTVQPFQTLTLTDLDERGAQWQTVRLSMDHLDNGALQNLGGFALTAPGAYVMSGTPSNITAALRAIVFVPVPNHIPVPTTVQTHFVLTANDYYVLAPVTNYTTVDVTAADDAPVITGTLAGQSVYMHSSIKPFTGALITDVDNDLTQALRVTVTLDNPIKGGLSSLGGFTNLGGGVYALGSSNSNVTAAIATTALRGLVFTPTADGRVFLGTNETTRFAIQVDDFYSPAVIDTNTTVITKNPWTAKVTASDKTNAAQFGWSVATTRNLAVIGEPHDPTGTKSGSAYLFSRSLDGSNTWTQIKKLLPPDGVNADEFGTAVAISDDRIVVGARFRDDNGTDSGCAYVYMRDQGGSNQWGFVKKLLASDGSANNQFGTAVSISGDIILVGSPFTKVGQLNNAGSSYLYSRNQGGSNQWGQVAIVTASDAAANDNFGSAVFIDADTLVIGSPLVGNSSGNYGAAYVYVRNPAGTNQWLFAKRLVAVGPPNGHLGTAVAVSGDIVVAGAPLVNSLSLGNSGDVFIYSRNQGGSNQWGQVKELIPSDLVAGDHFGAAVSIDTDRLVVGSPFASPSGASSGAAYFFAQNLGGTNNWGQLDKFVPTVIGASDFFGSAVAISRGTVVVGAYNGADNGVRPGTAFMFQTRYNNRPELLSPIPNQTVTVGSTVAFSIPVGTFSDPDVIDTLQVSLSSTPALPGWLSFNPTTSAFSGTASTIGTFPIAVLATDMDGFSVTNQFTITVVPLPDTHSSLSMNVQTLGGSPTMVISLTGVAGVQYKLQRTPSLSGTVLWTDIGVATADVNGVITFYDTITSGSMFYRAIAQ